MCATGSDKWPYGVTFGPPITKLPRKLKKRLKKQEARAPYRNSILRSQSGREALATAITVAFVGIQKGLIRDESVRPFNGRFA